jgi:hypothetical protein
MRWQQLRRLCPDDQRHGHRQLRGGQGQVLPDRAGFDRGRDRRVHADHAVLWLHRRLRQPDVRRGRDLQQLQRGLRLVHRLWGQGVRRDGVVPDVPGGLRPVLVLRRRQVQPRGRLQVLRQGLRSVPGGGVRRRQVRRDLGNVQQLRQGLRPLCGGNSGLFGESQGRLRRLRLRGVRVRPGRLLLFGQVDGVLREPVRECLWRHVPVRLGSARRLAETLGCFDEAYGCSSEPRRAKGSAPASPAVPRPAGS